MAVVAVLAALSVPGAAGAQPGLWQQAVPVSNVVASSPVAGGGYPDVNGVPVPGNCGTGMMNSNRSESWIAARRGTEDLVGTSKFFFDRYSTFYNFHLGSYTVPGGQPVTNNQVQGYECTTVDTQAMPPSWTNNTDPNVAFDTQGRAYQVTLPFNAYWTNLRPNGAIDVSYSDDLGRHWVKGNGGRDLEQSPNSSSLSFGHVEDKQWIAVNDLPGSPYQDHVYAAWAVFNGSAIKVRMAVSRDRGQTFSRAVTISVPSQVGPAVTYVYPAVDAAGDVYVSVVSFPPSGKASSIYVARSTDDGRTWNPFVAAVPDVGLLPAAALPNTSFRDGIVENFTASKTYPGHLYLTYEDWDGAQFDVYFTQSTDSGATWSAPARVNDNANPAATDQFQPSVAEGPGGAVAIAFYDRRSACPDSPSVLPADVGRQNFCIDVSVQAYRDSGQGAQPVGANVRASAFTWDPENPAQHVDGLGQMACASHDDPCSLSFIGDYFGLAVSTGNVYVLSVSTHYPSSVEADEGGPVYYQQQVLSTISRAALGI
ncbi:MAG TPA: sialidase family protein [Kribbella sp.]|nr:sialidase family protein [Kribbella sp.]